MVGIVTGPMNSGKTTRMKALQRKLGGDGFVMLKTMDGNQVKSYHAQRLSTGEKRLLVLRKGYSHDKFSEKTRIGPYRFDELTLNWVHTTMKQLIRNETTPLFLDEVGNLELCGEGFDATVKILKEARGTLYITVRTDLVDRVKRAYSLKNVRIIKGDEFNG